MPSVDRVLAEALELSEDERLELVDRLLDVQAEVAADPAIERAWIEEALRRREEWLAGQVSALPVDQALELMFAKP